LYQEVALGFAGYRTMKKLEIGPALMQLNEAPTVFAAIAWLDDLCSQGVDLDAALAEVKKHLLYTNHTLVQAVEAEFHRDQFNNLVMPNVKHPAVRDWVSGMFVDDRLKLSSLAIELASTKSGVSKLHARVSDANFRDHNGNPVHFEAVTNGISAKWTLPEIADYYHDLGILDEFDMPTNDYEEKLDMLDPTKMRELKRQGRQFMNGVLDHRQDQHGNRIDIPGEAMLFNFKRRFADYKRPDMIFRDPDRLAAILQEQNAHLVLTGKPHPDDTNMSRQLDGLLNLIDGNQILHERVHYVQDYDEELGQALAIGADCAINVPIVGKEACGTSWMKDMSNFQLVISTPDGGIADSDQNAYLIVGGDDEVGALYSDMVEAAKIIHGEDDRFKDEVVQQLKEYLPVISGSRMLGGYFKLFFRKLVQAAAA
jgi:starch phosphorylase